MSVKVRPYNKGKGWEIDISVLLPDGSIYRERKKSPVKSKSDSKRWGEDRVKHILQEGPTKKKEAPTLEQFAPRFMEGHAVANRQKPSGIAAKETIFRVHLIPALGKKRLDEITNQDISKLKGILSNKAPKTVNNILAVLGKTLNVAVEWEIIKNLPCTIKQLKVPETEMGFYDFDQYSRLVAASAKINHLAYCVVLLAGDAGLRCGEIRALEWADIDFSKRQIRVQRSVWKGHVNVTKGGKTRTVPMTTRLAKALHSQRHLISDMVLCRKDGSGLTQKTTRNYVLRSSRLASLERLGIHALRHTFISHLAMRGAPARAIQALAGHANLITTQRYMHLSPAAVDAAIQLLEEPAPKSAFGFGEMREKQKA